LSTDIAIPSIFLRRGEVTHNVAALNGQTYIQPLLARTSYSYHHNAVPTLLQLLHEVIHNLLQLRTIHSKDILEILNVLQQILRQILHGT